MKNYPTISWAIILIILFTNSACKKFVEIGLPKDELTTKKVFADSADANAALLGIYARIHSGLTFGSGLLTIYPGMSSDELFQTASDDNKQFYNNTLLSTNNMVGGMWSAGYSYIYTLNACVEGIENSHTLTDTQKAVFIGEARCLRAFIYFYLVNLYGPVPLVLTTDYNISKVLPRTSEDAVYKQIVEDLVYAKSVLPLNIDGNIRVNKDVATALLARVYLFRGNYSKAITEASTLIESNRYSIAATPNDVFLPQSTETIWGLLPVSPSRATWEGFNLIPSSSSRVPAYIISNDLFNAFDVNDLRKIQWIRFNTVNGVKYPYPYKYKMRVAGSITLENYVMLRLTEQYLIKAEAEANLNNLSAAETDLNKIRQRAGLQGFSADNDKALILKEIEKERQLEFAFEWGHRWFDLKRTQRANEILSAIKTNWKPTAVLYPIPQAQLERNSKLVQNDGY